MNQNNTNVNETHMKDEEEIEVGGVVTEEDTSSDLLRQENQQLQTDLESYKKKAEENWDKALRALSEVENIRKRSEREVENAHKYGVERLIKDLLPIIDSLEQTLQTTKETFKDQESIASLTQGIEMTYKMFLDVLKRCSVTPIDPVGLPFDPQKHEAMSMQVSESAMPGTVLTVYQKGYQLFDRVIRPARVIIASTK